MYFMREIMLNFKNDYKIFVHVISEVVEEEVEEVVSEIEKTKLCSRLFVRPGVHELF